MANECQTFIAWLELSKKIMDMDAKIIDLKDTIIKRQQKEIEILRGGQDHALFSHPTDDVPEVSGAV